MFPKPILLLTSSVGFTHNSDVILLTVIEAYFIMVDLHSAPVLVFAFFFLRSWLCLKEHVDLEESFVLLC